MSQLQRPMFPHAIDSTLLSTFRSCPQKFFRTYMEHWKPSAESVHLVAGKAFAEGIEKTRRAFYEDGKSAEDALAIGLQALIVAYGDFECPPESPKSVHRMAGALEYYFSQYDLETDAAKPRLAANGKRMIEFSFAEPLPINHPVTGQPILYTGRADMIADFCGGVYNTDEKTTSSLGQTWAKQWDLRSQFTGYTWAGRQAGIPVKGTLVRGVSILKTKYDTLQCITGRSDAIINRWLRQTVYDIQRMIRCWEAGYWDFNLDHSCAEYGGCPLKVVCMGDNPDDWLPIYFHKRVWDPLLRAECSVEEYEDRWGHRKMVSDVQESKEVQGDSNLIIPLEIGAVYRRD